MRENRLTITTSRPRKYVYMFTTDPKNTPLWIAGMELEEASSWPIELGTIYRNRKPNGPWSEYVVSYLEPARVFELTSQDGNYHVRYSYNDVSAGTEMEYFEWVDRGELPEPFTEHTLNKLKEMLEQ